MGSSETVKERDDLEQQRWWSVALVVFWALVIWMFALLLPADESDTPWSDRWLLVMGIVGAGLILVGGLGLFVDQFTGRLNYRIAGLGAVVAGGLLVFVALLMSSNGSVSPGVRFAVGVGGTAIAALAIGIGDGAILRGVRDSASLAAAVLVVGVVTYPEVDTIVDPETRQEVVKWMAVLIGVNAGADAIGSGLHTYRGRDQRGERETNS